MDFGEGVLYAGKPGEAMRKIGRVESASLEHRSVVFVEGLSTASAGDVVPLKRDGKTIGTAKLIQQRVNPDRFEVEIHTDEPLEDGTPISMVYDVESKQRRIVRPWCPDPPALIEARKLKAEEAKAKPSVALNRKQRRDAVREYRRRMGRIIR